MHDITYVKGLIAGIPIGINGRDGADVRIILRTLGHFSITYVDYKNDLRRYLKQFALWFKSFLQNENLTTTPPFKFSLYPDH